MNRRQKKSVKETPNAKQQPRPRQDKSAKNNSKAESGVKPKQKKMNDSDEPISPSDNSYERESESDSDSVSEEESSISQPKEVAVKNMQFRSRRGQKMKYLINRKKEQEDDEDDFWKNNKYFGQDDELEKDDEEDYVESSSGQDEFDSDFLSNEKEEKEDNAAEEQIGEEEDEQVDKKSKKRKGPEIETKPPTKKVKKTEPQKEGVFKYIHEEYTQDQLLAEAAHTQYFNLISLQRLISLEEEKKVYERRQHRLDPPKLVYRDSTKSGQRIQTISLVGYPSDANLFQLKTGHS